MVRIGMAGMALAVGTWAVAAAGEPVYEEEGPFRPGEGFGRPASCASLPGWIERAPETEARVTMVIDGEIVESHWDGALAYLIMCAPEEVQVMCVTYYPKEAGSGTVRFAGGYNRVGARQVILDPCLVYPAE